MAVSDRSKIIYLMILILFIIGIGFFWLDHIGLINASKYVNFFRGEPKLVTEASGDEPSLVEREEFEKEKEKFQERVEELDKREALLAEKEKEIESLGQKLEEIRKGLELEQKKLDDERKKYSGYK